MNFSIDAAVPVDDLAGGGEIAVEQLADLLGVQAFRERGEPDEVDEHDRDEPELGGDRFRAAARTALRLRGGALRRGPAAAAAGPRYVPHSPQNLAPGGLAAPQVGQSWASRCPHSRQNLRLGSFCVPQLLQVSTSAG